MTRIIDGNVERVIRVIGVDFDMYVSGHGELSLPAERIDPTFYDTFQGGPIQIALSESSPVKCTAVFHKEKLVYPTVHI